MRSYSRTRRWTRASHEGDPHSQRKLTACGRKRATRASSALWARWSRLCPSPSGVTYPDCATSCELKHPLLRRTTQDEPHTVDTAGVDGALEHGFSVHAQVSL